MSNEQHTQAPDDPSGPGWRDVEPDEILQTGDMYWVRDHWKTTQKVGMKSSLYGNGYRRRIEQQPEPSDSTPERIDSWEFRLAKMTEFRPELEALLAEAEQSGQQVNAELQDLRKQVQTLTLERDRYRNQLAGAIEHSGAPEAQARLLDRLEAWLRPVLELVEENPEGAAALAVAVLQSLPGIASQLTEE